MVWKPKLSVTNWPELPKDDWYVSLLSYEREIGNCWANSVKETLFACTLCFEYVMKKSDTLVVSASSRKARWHDTLVRITTNLAEKCDRLNTRQNSQADSSLQAVMSHKFLNNLLQSQQYHRAAIVTKCTKPLGDDCPILIVRRRQQTKSVKIVQQRSTTTATVTESLFVIIYSPFWNWL